MELHCHTLRRSPGGAGARISETSNGPRRKPGADCGGDFSPAVRTPVPWPRSSLRRRIHFAIAGILAFTAASSIVSPADATHTQVTTVDLYVPQRPGINWNGYKVYLSSPRHRDSRSWGECGWEENINGRHFNVYAAREGASPPNNAALKDRGYITTVGANWRDNGAMYAKSASNNWGANVHIVTHTNASVGCGSSAQYLLTMYRTGNANSINLSNQLRSALDPVIPGSQNSWNCDGLIECNSVNAPNRAYVELFFHTNLNAVNWFQDNSDGIDGIDDSWRYGYALDRHLGSPR